VAVDIIIRGIVAKTSLSEEYPMCI